MRINTPSRTPPSAAPKAEYLTELDANSELDSCELILTEYFVVPFASLLNT